MINILKIYMVVDYVQRADKHLLVMQTYAHKQ